MTEMLVFPARGPCTFHPIRRSFLTDKRVGVVAVLVTDRSQIAKINQILSDYASLMLGRMGIPIKERGISVISLIIEGTTDEIGAMTGKLGRLGGVEVKSTLTRYRGDSREFPEEQP